MNRLRASATQVAALACMLLFADAAAAATVGRVGVNSVRFEWEPASGDPLGYGIWRHERGVAELDRWVYEPGVSLEVSPGDRFSISIRAGRYVDGEAQIGPTSELSDEVLVLHAPMYPSEGVWALECASCQTAATRSLHLPIDVNGESLALPYPWRVAGVEALVPGGSQLVWYNPLTGELALWDSVDLTPVPFAYTAIPTNARIVGSADFDDDGARELIVQEPGSDVVELYGHAPFGIDLVAELPGIDGARLLAARDFDGDGREDLLWHREALRRVEIWTIADDIHALGPVSWLLDSVHVIGTFAPLDAEFASAGDYDGDGWTDLLWQRSDGELVLWNLEAGQVRDYSPLDLPDAEPRTVVGSVDVGFGLGDAIAVQQDSGRLEILLPQGGSAVFREVVIDLGSQWRVRGVLQH